MPNQHTETTDSWSANLELCALGCMTEKAQPFGQKVKQFTSEMVFAKVVTVKLATKDPYGRTVACVNVAGKSLNEELTIGSIRSLRASAAGGCEHHARSQTRPTPDAAASAHRRRAAL